MANLRLQDLPLEMRMKVAKQLGVECPDGKITTYHVCLSIAGKFVHVKSTDMQAMAKLMDGVKDKHLASSMSVYASEVFAS